MVELTVVTPIDLSRRAESLVSRTLALAEAVSAAGWQMVVGHADRGSPHDAALRQGLAPLERVRLVSEAAPEGQANLARLRNIAAALADNEIVLLLDADIQPDADLFAALGEQVNAGVGMAMAPCIYVSEAGMERLAKQGGAAHIVATALDYFPKYLLHWAMPSSVMAFRREDYEALGGFCEEYEGHGYEDLDFMLRLALAKGLVAETAELLVDRPYRAPLLSEGFRNALARLCLGNLLDGKIAFHLFHERENADPYYRSRVDNAALFQSRFAYLKERSDRPQGAPPLISDFFDECRKRAIDPAQYHALFDARPRHKLKRAQL